MKKTVQVNLSAQVFVLDDDAYERLSHYLERIAKLYAHSPGKDEILQDIEVRIAELFLERLGETKKVVVLADVDAVIEIMGRPEQFESDAFDEEDQQSRQNSNTRFRTKRLYRDSDDKVVGGVCSGIGYYFGLDPIWIRLAFVCALIFFGTGVLLYLILLIVVPEAKTIAEKLHMKGEPMDISGIGRSIEDELNAFGERISKDDGPFGRRSGKKLVRGIDRFFNLLAEILRNMFNFIGKFLGGIFIAVGVCCAIALIAGVLGIADFIHFNSGSWSASMGVYEWGEIVFQTSEWMGATIIGLLLILGIPFIALAYGGFLLLFPKNRVPYLGLSLFGLWFLGLIFSIFSGFSVLKSFSKEEAVVDTILLEDLGITSDTLTIKLGEDPFNISSRRAYYANNDFMIKMDDGNIVIGNVDVTVVSTPTDKASMEIVRESSGANFEEAREKAKAISYLFENDSSSISFNAYFTFPVANLLRSQEVIVKLFIPEGMTIYLDESSKRFIDDIPNVTNTYDPYMVGHHWRMEKQGLTCVDCKTEVSSKEVIDNTADPIKEMNQIIRL